MAVDYNDKRLTQVESEKKVALAEHEKLYDGLSKDVVNQYQGLADSTLKYAEEQKKAQQQLSDLAIQKLENQQANAKKDYIKEQSGAYVDWRKQSNQYGAEAEQMAASGLTNTGYSESSQVSMYNTYQMRVATARESFVRVNADFDIAMAEARAQNSSILAEIAFNANKEANEYILQGMMYKNQLLTEAADKKLQIEQAYHTRYTDVLDQINTENALAENQRQFNESMAFQREKEKNDNAIQQAQLALQREQFNWTKSQASKSSSGGSVKKSSSKSSSKKKSSSSKKSTGKVDTSKTSPKTSGDTVKTYSQAAKKLQKAGATTGDGGLMTRSEWLRRKNSGSKRAELAYDSYADYLNSFTAWRLQNPEK